MRGRRREAGGMRIAPLWDGTANHIVLIWGSEKQNYFFERYWTETKSADELICPSGSHGLSGTSCRLTSIRHRPLDRAIQGVNPSIWSGRRTSALVRITHSSRTS